MALVTPVVEVVSRNSSVGPPRETTHHTICKVLLEDREKRMTGWG